MQNQLISCNRNSAGQSVLSIMKFLSALGIIKYQHGESKNVSVVKRDTELTSVRTAKSGIFEPLVRAGDDVSEGTPYDRRKTDHFMGKHIDNDNKLY